MLREYCADASIDITCPLPVGAQPSPKPVVHQGNDSSTPKDIIPRKCICGMCGLSGHNRHPCQNIKK